MKTILEKIEGFTLEEYKDGTSVLLHSESGIVHLLNTTATFLYKLCNANMDKEELFDSYIKGIDLSDGDISIEEIKMDFENAIKDFSDRGILN